MNKIYQKSFFIPNKAGFTLIELLVVVLIIGILASVAVPQYQLAVYKARFNKVRPFVDSLARAQEVYYMANGQYAKDLHDLDVTLPSDCTYEYHSSYSYDVVECKDVTLHVGRSANVLLGIIKNCPVFKPGCVVYNVPYHINASRIYGTSPNCSVYQGGSMTDRAREFGKKTCLALGGVEASYFGNVFWYL